MTMLCGSAGYNGRTFFQYIAGLTATLAAFCAGINLAWTAQISQELLDGKLGFPLTSDELGWVASLVPLGAAFLSLFTGTICDFLGRKLTMLVLIIPSTLGWALIVWADSLEMLYAGRFVTGMAAGAFTVLSSLYTSEIAQKEIRGALGSYVQLMITAGVLFASVVAVILPLKWYSAVCGIVPLIFGGLFLFMPETPTYLLKKQKVQKAHKVLLRLRGTEYNIDKEAEEIETSLKEKQSFTGPKVIKDSLKKPSSRKACIIGFGLMIFKVTCGVDALTVYTAYIFAAARTDMDPQLATIILGVKSVITAIFQSAIIDKYGRRVLLWLSALVMGICLAIVGLTLMLKDRNIISRGDYIYVDYLPLIALAVFGVAFSVGLGPVPWVILGEIFPQEIKSLAASIGTFLSWITAFAVTKLFIMMDTSWGGDITFFVFALFNAVTVVFVLMLVPETKNKSFSEIQKAL